MKIVQHPTLNSLVILGPRVIPGISSLSNQSQAQQVFVVIVKATYQVGTTSDSLAGSQQPVWMKDEIFNDKSLRYEHDLAIYKPKADIVILGQPAPPDPNPLGNEWKEWITTDTQSMIGDFDNTGLVKLNGTSFTRFWPAGAPITFGWQTRLEGQRFDHTGSAGEFKPDHMVLPLNFKNLFFNGGLYLSNGETPFSHLVAGSRVNLVSWARYDNGAGGTEIHTSTQTLHLPSTFPRAVLSYRSGAALNTDLIEEDLAFLIDTLVYEKASQQYYVVWRAVWDFASQPADRYVSLVLS